MRDSEGGSSSSGVNRPFIPGDSDRTPSGLTPPGGLAPPFVPGRESTYPQTRPDVITDQVAELASRAELPSITEFLYEEEEEEVGREVAAEEQEYAEPPPVTPAAPPSYVPPPQPAYAEAPRVTPRHPAPSYEPPPRPTYAPPSQPTYAPPSQPRYAPPRAAPTHQTPVPPLPGFTPSRGVPAGALPPDQRMTPAGGPRSYRPPSSPPPQPASPASPAPPALEPWATGEWQRYDWASVAALSPEDRVRAAQAWSDLDWEREARGRSARRREAIAAALETIAHRVRAGELPVFGPATMSEEAAAAAALAALLAKRP